MDIQKQIAFEKFQAKDSNCDYEELKQRLDHFEKLSGHRYLPTSPRHEAWLVWNAAWQAAKAVPKGFVLVPMVPSERMINAVRQCYEGEAYLPYSLYSEFVNQAIIERMEAQEPAND